MKRSLDLATTVTAVCVTTCGAFALACTAYYLGFSPQEIRIVAMSIAVTLAVLIAIDFFGKKLGKAK